MLLTLAVGQGAGSTPAARRASQPRITTVVLNVPAGSDPSEPHLALDPADPDRLYAVAQTVAPGRFPFSQELLWRSSDGGRSWVRSPLLGVTDNSTDGFAGDPVVAAGRNGLVLYGTLTFALDRGAGTATQHVGTRVSTDGGATFRAFGGTDEGFFPVCIFDGTCSGPPPEDVQFVDKPWLALDGTGGRFDGNAYLAWVRQSLDGAHQLLLSVSRDGGASYGQPVLLQSASDVDLGLLEELVQLGIRPDGTVDAVWNGMRDAKPAIFHSFSVDGGGSFSAPEVVVQLRPDADVEGVVTSLAVSDRGRLGLCWSQARSPDRYDARVACKVTDGHDRWSATREPLPDPNARQYLPAAAFRGEQLWVAAYTSDARSTSLVAARADEGNAPAVVVDRWPVPAGRICAPHPPNCRDDQTFIGDYIGFVGTRQSLIAAYVAPSANATELNRVLVSTFR